MKQDRRSSWALALAFFCALQGLAHGLEVRVTEAPRVAFAGDTVRLGVELSDLDQDVRSVKLETPQGVVARGPVQRGQNVTIINGRRRVAYPLWWEIQVPRKSGRYPLGPVVCTDDAGRITRQEVPALQVVRRPEPDTQLLLVDAPAAGPVGLPFRVTYTLLTSEERYEEEGVFGSRSPFGLLSLELGPFRAGLSATPVELPDREGEGTRLSLGDDRSVLIYEGLVEHEGAGYHATVWALEVVPRKPGPIDLSARAEVRVVSGTRVVRSFFGLQRVAKGIARTVRSEPKTYTVEPLPPGAPPGFTGAVGRFAIEASCARREANAFDPIEVRITVRGEGLLEDLTLPRWQDFPEIARDFQVATDVDPGTLAPDGKSKTFTKTFRAKNADVHGLPPLPFPFFDPRTRRYEVARSAAIPLTIRPVETVTSEDAVGGQAGPSSAALQTNQTVPPQTIASRSGVRANYLELDDRVPDLRSPARFGPGLWALVVAPPLLWLLALAGARLRARLAAGPGPLGEARAALAGSGSDVDAVRAAVNAYAARRLELGGEVTADEVVQALRARAVDPAIVERAESLWRALEAARFAGGGGVPPDALSVLEAIEGSLEGA
ncbi:MAG: hypothetical protein D6731_15860 [Planctomycetota bacterium]|nr:MAG: hypothetical protein D6731_15860 [Planctomycetota bacterium]